MASPTYREKIIFLHRSTFPSHRLHSSIHIPPAPRERGSAPALTEFPGLRLPGNFTTSAPHSVGTLEQEPPTPHNEQRSRDYTAQPGPSGMSAASPGRHPAPGGPGSPQPRGAPAPAPGDPLPARHRPRHPRAAASARPDSPRRPQPHRARSGFAPRLSPRQAPPPPATSSRDWRLPGRLGSAHGRLRGCLPACPPEAAELSGTEQLPLRGRPQSRGLAWARRPPGSRPLPPRRPGPPPRPPQRRSRDPTLSGRWSRERSPRPLQRARVPSHHVTWRRQRRSGWAEGEEGRAGRQ